jgi:hypothetical protein
MLHGTFRPWGPLTWLLPRLSPTKWNVLGCLATEERCLATWTTAGSAGRLKSERMLEIHDEHPADANHSRFFTATERRIAESRGKYLSSGGKNGRITSFYLADAHARIIDVADEFAERCGPNVVIDVSCLPKRFFFPIIRRVMLQPKVKNVIATYTVPLEYTKAQLAEDPTAWTFLPTFLPPDPEPKDRVVIIGLGYELLALRDVLAGNQCELLFPFPSLPPGIRRNWEFVHELSAFAKRPPERVYIYDVSEAFERIKAITNRGARYAVLAPYGPKTLSLAMCLYALSTAQLESPASVYYTQPRVYNPSYSTGVQMNGGVPEILSYCLRLKGKDLYCLDGLPV